MQRYSVVTIPLDSVVTPEWVSLLKEIESWFAKISRNLCRIDFEVLTPLTSNIDQIYFTPIGGVGAPPRNSQTLIKQLLNCLDVSVVRVFEYNEKHLLVIANNAFISHTWRLRNRGMSYSIVPSNATFGAVTHELGHLLFDWPDLAWEKSLGEDCLMSLGALYNNGTPALPCAPLRVKQGWIDPLVIDQLTTMQDISEKHIGAIDWQRHNVLVEYRARNDTAFLLIYTAKNEGKLFHPKIIARIPVTNTPEKSLVLGLIAPKLRLRYSI
jgi:hypothetical protein